MVIVVDRMQVLRKEPVVVTNNDVTGIHYYTKGVQNQNEIHLRMI